MFSYKIPIAIVTTMALLQPPVVIAQNIAEVNNIAINISVKITGHSNGSGFILERAGNIYSVVTNKHVVPIETEYEVQTYDGTKHRVINRQEIPDLDLAIIQFESTEVYELAELGDSDELEQRQSISVAGFPGEQTDLDIIDGQIRSIQQGIIDNPQAKQGYALIYTNQTLPGSSGGAVLDKDGRVVAINGEASIDSQTGRDISRGIPINLLLITLGKPIPVLETKSDIPSNSFPANTNNESSTSVISTPVKYQLAYPITKAVDRIYGQISFDINSVAVSQNNIISGGDDYKIKIWNLDTGELERTLEGHSADVYSVAVDENTIVSGGADETIKIWNLGTGALEHTLEGHLHKVYSVAISENKIASGSSDNTVKIWNSNTGELERTLNGHSDIVTSVAISKDKLVSGSWDRTIKIWNLNTGELERTLNGHLDEIQAIAVSENNIVSGSSDNTIKIWDLATGKLEQTITEHTTIHSVAINGNTVIGGFKERVPAGKVKIWNLFTGELEQTIPDHYVGNHATVNSLAVVNNKIVSGNSDSTIEIWELQE